MKNIHEYSNNFSEYQKAIHFLEKGCKCGCSTKLSREKFAQLRVQFQNLSKPSQDAVVMGQLLIMDEGDITTSSRFPKRERTNTRAFYRWNNRTPICQQTYLNSLGISRNYLKNLSHLLAHEGLAERTHGNIGRIPQ
jgi:hypothetical protein